MYQLTRLTLDRPKSMLLTLGVITAFFAAGLPNLRTEFGYRVLVGDDHPSIVALDELIEQFGGGYPLYVAWECGNGFPCETVFDRESLEMAYSVTRTMSSLPEIVNIEGPATTALIVPAEEGFAVRRFVENGRVVSDLDFLADRALQDPLWVGSVISSDGNVGVIVIQTIDSENDTAVRVVDTLRDTTASYEADGFEFFMSGDLVGSVTAGRDLARSTANLIPFTVIVIGIVLFALSRSVRSVAIALATMGVALIWTFGLLGWLDWPQDGILEVLAPLILIVGVCDAFHLLSRYGASIEDRIESSGRQQRRIAVLSVTEELGPPCLITTLTSCGAFLSFVTSALDTFVRFGITSAFGIAACLILSFTLLPLLTLYLPADGTPAARVSLTWRSALAAIVRAGEIRARSILVSSLLAVAICGIGWLAFLRVDTNWYESFGEESEVIQGVRFLEERVRPGQSLELDITLPATSAIEDPATIESIEDLSDFLGQVDGLGARTSIVDFISRLNRIVHDDDPRFERPGDTTGANAELLELIGFDNPDLIRNWVTFDRSKIRLSVEADELPSKSRARVLQLVEGYALEKLPPGWKMNIGGQFVIGYDWIRDVQSTQIRSFPTAFVIVFALVALFLRSLRLAFAAMLPTLLPVVITLGTMGLMGMSLDVGRAMIAAILIGIAVDDAIHILRHYQIKRSMGEDPADAIRGAILHTGRAVVTTSLALSLGFLTLMASSWQTISSFGFFVALAIMGALAAVLFVLPALIFTFARER